MRRGPPTSSWRGEYVGASAVVLGATLFLLLSLSSMSPPPITTPFETGRVSSSSTVQAGPSSPQQQPAPSSSLSIGENGEEPAPPIVAGPPIKPAGMELERLSKARQVADHAARAIADDYGNEAEELFASVHFLSRDFIKNKIVRAILQSSSSSSSPTPPRSRFTMSFSGTSVTAGHDNYFWQSYPIVFHSVANESFAAAGIELVVRNHAMGNNPPIPAAFCVGSQLGSDIDVASWEFGMMVGGDSKNAYTELWIRNALSLPNQPAIMLLDPGEAARKPEDGGGLPTEVRKGDADDWSKSFFDHKTGYDLLKHYKDFGVHTQAMFEATWKLDTKERYNFKTLVEKDKPTSRPASWHPGPHGHKLRGRILAYHYLRILEEAIADAYFAIENNEVASLLHPPPPLKLPSPLACDPVFCGQPSSCALTFEPRAESYLLDYVTEPEKVVAGKSHENGDNSRWHVQLFEMDQNAVRNAKESGFGYLDLKYTLQANKAAGPLTFKIHSKSKGHLLICQPPGVWGRLPDGAAPLNEGAATITIDGGKQPVQLADKEWEKQRGIECNTCFPTLEQYPPGDHTITVTPMQDDKYVMVSGLVWFM